ncbi:peptidoglycan-binding protein [Streptomyces turgidiscabies]|uniref:peptidoglycan-binding protein n=1 Tax=Streptomyces turgidiscabies TaxID=85558 RepID=UPI0038F670AC
MSRLNSRRQLAVLVGVVVLIGAGGWVAGTQVRSPADAAAEHSAPKAGPVTVAVRRQSLVATVVASGSVEFASPRPLSLAGSVGTGASSAAAGEGAEQRITKAPVAGSEVKEGDVLMTVNGRPVLALRGKVPMYRAMGPGASGDDVKQLQGALRRLGFDPGSISGNYRQGTASAVTAWYADKGYEAQKPSAEDQQQLGQLQQAVSSAQETLLTTNSTTSTTSGTGTGVEGGTSSPSPQSSTDAQIHQLQVGSAKKSLELANDALGTFQATYRTKLPAGEVVFFPELPVRLNKVTVKTGDTATGPIGTVTSSDLEVQAVVPGTDAELLRKGMPVELTTTDGKKAKGTVSALGADAAPSTGAGTGEDSDTDTSGGEGSDGAPEEGTGGAATGTSAGGASSPVQLRISVPSTGALAGEAETAVKVTIRIGASDGEVLVVPLAAIRTSADGKARVQVERAGKVSDVHVTVGLSAAGLVEVKPTGGTLEQGDKVVVGE